MKRRGRLSSSASLGIRALLFSSALSGLARADSGDAAKAESLFRSGKELLTQKDFAHACPMLADSYRSDPATGTLLALAICHEGLGKLASAWREYTEVANRSQRESRPDRAKVARGRVSGLEQRISLLTIVVPPEDRALDGIEMKRDGNAVSPTVWGKPLAVDGGSHTIEVTARGKQRWSTTVTVASSQDLKTIKVPSLEDEEAAAPAPAAAASTEEPPKPQAVAPKTDPAPKADLAPKIDPTPKVEGSPSASPAADTPRRASAWQGAGIATFVAGAASLGFGTVFTIRAVNKNKDSKAGCFGNICTSQGTQDRWDAHDAGNLATYGFIAGGTLVVGGAAMYLLGRPSPTLSACTRGTCVHASLGADTDGVGGVLQGTF